MYLNVSNLTNDEIHLYDSEELENPTIVSRYSDASFTHSRKPGLNRHSEIILRRPEIDETCSIDGQRLRKRSKSSVDLVASNRIWRIYICRVCLIFSCHFNFAETVCFYYRAIQKGLL